MRKTVKVYVTAKDTGERMNGRNPLAFENDSGKEHNIINIYDDIVFQKITGFGAAFTEAAAVTFYKMSLESRKKILKAFFDSKEGIGYSFCRTHINSCDFSESNYACDEVEGDTELKHFNIDREKINIIPFIKEAQKVSNGNILLFASPWSPPAWMKTNGQMNHGGKLREEYAEVWAKYYAKFIRAFAAEGISIWGITVQNEPAAVQIWDSCIYTAFEEKEFVKRYLSPALEREGLGHIKIMIWDHNRDKLYERVKEAFEDNEASRHIWGSAFHWYSGDHFEALDIVKRRWPDKELVFSEGCREKGPAIGEWETGERYGHDIMGCLLHGTTAWTDWNIILDENGGPNHVGNYCDAPVIADTRADTLIFESSYYYIGHFSRFIVPGSVRIAHTCYTGKLEAGAFKTPEDNIVVVIMNSNEAEMPANLRFSGQLASFEVPARSIITAIF